MALSEPRTGIHAIRVFDVAIIDVLFTIVAAFAISREHFLVVFIILLVLSVIVHSLLGIKTRTNSWLF